MSIDNENIIEKIKQYLREWNISGKYPNKFMDNMELSDDKAVVYNLGSYLYFSITNEEYKGELTHKNVKKPRIYQFLSVVLKSNRDEREINPEFLLSILEKDDRDTIEDTLKEEEYMVEYFSTLGLTRLKNQDYLGYYQFDNALALIVADGVGGGEGGEMASQIATDFVIDSLKKYDLQEESNITNILQNIVFETNQKVLNYADKYNMRSMGTTLSIALIIEQYQLYIAHIGDSRIYALHPRKKPRQITEDHSEVEILYRLGKIKEEDKKKYKKNILRYAIGVKDLKRENIFVQKQYVYKDTALLLCSDGLWEKINIDENVFTKDFDALKEQIYEAVPTDNVTVIRYFPLKQIENYFYEIEESLDEEFVEKPQQKQKKKIDHKVSKAKTTKSKNLNKKTSKRKKTIDNINSLLIKIALFLSIALVIFSAFYFLFNSQEQVSVKQEGNVSEKTRNFFQSIRDRDMDGTKSLIANGIDVNLRDEHNHTALYYSYKNRDTNMSLFLIQQQADTKEVIKEIQLDINRTEMELNKLKAFYKRLKDES